MEKIMRNMPAWCKDVVEFIKEHKTKILFWIILIIAIFTRLYRIDELPQGVHVDEAGIAYDAYCFANYGVDRYLNKMPVYMINFGLGQSALYTYIDSIFIKMLGLNMLSIRLPSAILGITAIVLGYFMVKKELGEKFALAFMTLITICPWHIMASRWGLDCNLLAPMLIISMYLLLRVKGIWGYIAAGISFGLTLYTYALSYIIVPIFLLLTLIFMLYTKRIKFRHIIIMGIPIFLLALPLMLMLLVNNGVIDEIRTPFMTIPKLGAFRGEEIDFANIEENMNFFDKMVTNDGLVYNAFPEFGAIYKFSIFLAVFGIFIEINNLAKSIKKREFTVNALMLFLYISVMACMLIISGPNINKANAVYIPLLFFTCTTLRMVHKNYPVFMDIMIIFFIMSFIGFSDFYFNKYEDKYKNQIYFEKDLIEAIDYVENTEEFANKNVYINTSSQQPYIYTLLYNKTSPYEFNEERHYKIGYNMSYGRYYFNSTKIDDNAVYIIKDKRELAETLVGNDFKTRYLNTYAIMYK